MAPAAKGEEQLGARVGTTPMAAARSYGPACGATLRLRLWARRVVSVALVSPCRRKSLSLADDANRLIAGTCDALGRFLRVQRCYVVQIDEAGDRAWVTADYHDHLPSLVGEFRVSDYPSHLASDARAGRLFVSDDTSNDPRSAAILRDRLRAVGISRPRHCAVDSGSRVGSVSVRRLRDAARLATA